MELVPLPVVVPLFAAAFLAGAGHWLPRRATEWIAIVVTVSVAAMSFALLLTARAGTLVYWMGGWRPRGGIAVGVGFTVDVVGAGLGVLSAVLACAALVFTLRRFDDVHAHFHALMLVFLAALVAFGETGDLFDMFVFFELMSATAYALCAYKSDEVGSLQGALNFAVTNTVGAFLVLFGIALVYGRTGALGFGQIAQELGASRDALVVASFFLIACGFLVKAAVFPFHFWLADAHAVAPTPVSVMFSGVMVTAGLYAVARVWWSVFAVALGPAEGAVRTIFLVLGTATAVVGGAMCWAQRHLKRLLAFSTIGHMGMMMLGVALVDGRGLAGSIVYALGHGLVKGALFLLAGALLHSRHTVDEKELQGRGPAVTGVVWAAAGLGLAGLPPFGTFTGSEGIVEASHRSGYGWIEAATVFVEIVTAGAVLRVGGRVFLGWGPREQTEGGKEVEEEPETEGPRNVPVSMTASAVALVVASLAVGIVPQLRGGALVAAARLQDTHAYVARVMGGAGPIRDAVAPQPPAPLHVGRGFVITGAAVLLALATLFRRRLPSALRSPVKAVFQACYRGLRAIHTGHVADYVTWVLVGTAAIGLAAELAMRR